jgi:hypothetical protein
MERLDRPASPRRDGRLRGASKRNASRNRFKHWQFAAPPPPLSSPGNAAVTIFGHSGAPSTIPRNKAAARRCYIVRASGH